MPYQPLNWQAVEDGQLRKVFNHADMLLHDVYGMFRTLPPEDGDGGGGNFSICLILLCIIDGLATWVWPTRNCQNDQEKRFKQLIRERLAWGPEGKGRWVDQGNAADQLYLEFRNPIVHELGTDKPTDSRPKGHTEPVIGKWGRIPDDRRDIETIDGRLIWDYAWSILYEDRNDVGHPHYKLSCAALYWAVKQLAIELLDEHKSGDATKQ